MHISSQRPKTNPAAGLARQTILVFILMAVLSGLLIGENIVRSNRAETLKQQNAVQAKSAAVYDAFAELVYKTQTLATLVIHENHEIKDLQRTADVIIDDPAILNVLFAPNGVVTEVYPMRGNEDVLGLDFFDQDHPGNREAAMAHFLGQLVLGGPFPLIQGGTGLVGRLPVFIGKGANKKFWGLVSVTLKYPDVLERVNLDELSEKQGYRYEIWRVNPDDGEVQTIAGTPNLNTIMECVERPLMLFNAQWRFSLGPVHYWYTLPVNWALILGGLLGSLLVASVVQINHRLRLMKSALEEKEKDLTLSMHSAQEANRVKSAFLATMSHEIRTPMNGIIGYAELAAYHPATRPEIRDYLTKIKTSADGLLQIINNILDITKIETGRLEFENTPFNPDDVLAQCETVGTPLARKKGVSLGFHSVPAHGLLPVGDPTRLRQALVNLISNAVKFTDGPDGAVRVEARAENHAPGRLRLSFRVSDNGIGMTPDQLRRVFDPFIQADSSITRKYGGSGLGLSITKSIVLGMGGELEVESAPGGGTSFHFALDFPAVPADGAAAAKAKAPLRKPIFDAEVLVCEDNEINQDVIREHLTNVGIRSVFASNGEEAVRIVSERAKREKPFALVLMDIHMPVLDGMEATRRLKAMGVRTPIVAITANVMATDCEGYLRLGMSDFLGKPFQAPELWACLLKFLQPVGFEDLPAPGLPAAASSAGRSINRAAGLARSAGNAGLYRRLLTHFLRDNREAAQEIREAAAEGDFAFAHRRAHSLKSAAAMIGAEELSREASRLEETLLAVCDGGGGADGGGGLSGSGAESSAESSFDSEVDYLEKELERVVSEIGVESGGSTRREAVTGIDKARARELLDTMTLQLASADVSSLDSLGEVSRVLSPLGDIVDSLAAQVENYDFEAALATCAIIRRRLE